MSVKKHYKYYENHTEIQTASNDGISAPKMLYYTLGSLIFLAGGAAFWLGILYENLPMTVAGGITIGFGLLSSLMSHLIKKDKAKHRHIVHYECLLQRWYTAVIAFAFIIGCAVFWIGAVYGHEQLICIGMISHFLLIFTVFFDSLGNRQRKKRKK